MAEAVDGAVVARETSPEEMATEVDKREKVEGSATAYWTTLAPNVEDYSGGVAKMIAAGSGHLIWGILWCGDVTVDRLKWGHDFMKKRMGPGSNAEIHPFVRKRIRRLVFVIFSWLSHCKFRFFCHYNLVPFAKHIFL